MNTVSDPKGHDITNVETVEFEADSESSDSKEESLTMKRNKMFRKRIHKCSKCSKVFPSPAQ